MFVDGARTPMSPGVYNPTHGTALGGLGPQRDRSLVLTT